MQILEKKDFFKKKNVPVMTVKELFDFVTDPTVNEHNMDDYLDKSMELASNRENITEKQKVDDEVGFYLTENIPNWTKYFIFKKTKGL